MNRRLMMLTQQYVSYKYCLELPFWRISAFYFGITWAEVDKIVVVADNFPNSNNITDGSGQMLLCGRNTTAPWIGFQNGEFKTTNLSNVKFNLTPEEYNDRSRERHDYVIKFTSTSTNEITNIWDERWNKGVRYYKFEFWKGHKLLKQFIPDPTNPDRLYDKVNFEYITASQLGVYKLHELQEN